MRSMGTVQWIFVHTAAFPGECGAADLDRRHRERGRAGIGYHYVVRRSGGIEPGRDLSLAGAHVQGCNSRSVGICCEGPGDDEAHTSAQREALLGLCRTLMSRYDLPAERVLGHREVNVLIDVDLVGDHYRTDTTCPGRLVNMDEIRAALADATDPDLDMPDSLGLFGWLLRRRTPTRS